MKNAEIAEILFEIADLLELQNIQWKPRAYRNAAIKIQSMAADILEFYKQGRLEEIPGIGEHIAKKISEILETGKLEYLEKLRRQMPIDIEALNAVPGMGPKKAMALYKKLGIKNLKQLKKAAEKGKIAGLKGFGKKTEREILQGIEFAGKAKARHLLGTVLPIAEQIKQRLEKSGTVLRAEVAGSLRRSCETIGDIDILVSAQNPKKASHFFVSMEDVKKILAKGITKSSVIVEDKLQVDLRIVKKDEWGSALQYFTGSKQHGIELRKIAQKKGLKLSEYGVFKGKKRISGKTEKQVYNSLGLDYIEPELRESRGEIEAAKKHSLPKLVTLSDIKGDFHLHSDYSDGQNSVEEMAKACSEKKYSFCAMTDHIGMLRIANSMSPSKIKKQSGEIDRIQKKFPGLRIFKGCEADIKKDGSIAAPPKTLKGLDIVCASIHSALKISKKEQTNRLLKAVENPLVNIIGHPAGRKLGQRPGYELDFEKIFVSAKKHSTALEINCMPDRLDLNDVNSRNAVEKNTVLAIGSDSHSTEHLRFMEFGIGTARRAWAEKKNILNTWPLKKIESFIEK